jgi:MATE family multidrug resistance protein
MSSYFDVFKLVWPIALGMVNNAVMQCVDRIFLAHYSSDALEAILPATTLSFVFAGFFQTAVGYSGVFISQAYGAGDEKKCNLAYNAGTILALLAGVIVLPLVPLGNWLLEYTSSDPQVCALEKTYYSIITSSGIFLFLQTVALSYFTGKGRTLVAFVATALGNVFNIVADIILIFGAFGLPAMGMAGAAYATVISLFMQFLFLAVMAKRSGAENFYVPHKEDWRMLRNILRYGLPVGLYEVLNMASFTIFVFVTRRVGEVSLAVSNACFTVCFLLYAPVSGFAIGAQTLVGQALGRGDETAARDALKKTLVLGLGFVFVVCLGAVLLHKPILSLFVPNADISVQNEFYSTGFMLFICLCGWMLFDAADIIVSGALKGAGDTRFVMMWMFVSSFLIWLPIVFLVAAVYNTITALWATQVLYVVVISAGTILRWRGGKWKNIRLSEKL